jgi:hypothetical protein
VTTPPPSAQIILCFVKGEIMKYLKINDCFDTSHNPVDVMELNHIKYFLC